MTEYKVKFIAMSSVDSNDKPPTIDTLTFNVLAPTPERALLIAEHKAFSYGYKRKDLYLKDFEICTMKQIT